MPATAIKHMAKKADVSVDRAEHLWHKAKDIVSKEYGAKHKGYYALVMGITKKMLGLGESLDTLETFLATGVAPIKEDDSLAQVPPMANLLSYLLIARNVAHMWHWKVKSFSQHMALGELYDKLSDYADELAEYYIGTYGDDIHIHLSDPNPFSEQDPVEFVRQVHDFLASQHDRIPQQGFLVNKFEEMQGVVAQIKYKMENLR